MCIGLGGYLSTVNLSIYRVVYRDILLSLIHYQPSTFILHPVELSILASPWSFAIVCVLTLILISLFCCNNWLIKEPISQNPFKLIYGVSKYAFKTKYPQNRSAFTYCEDEVISWIDYGKSKYGGPFTTEQVEDVKTFYKTLPIVILSGKPAGEMMVAGALTLFLKSQFVLPDHGQEMQSGTNFSISNIIPSADIAEQTLPLSYLP